MACPGTLLATDAIPHFRYRTSRDVHTHTHSHMSRVQMCFSLAYRNITHIPLHASVFSFMAATRVTDEIDSTALLTTQVYCQESGSEDQGPLCHAPNARAGAGAGQVGEEGSG